MISQAQFQSSLENIYISPLEMCNLSCVLCYTKKTPTILSNEKIKDFTHRYTKHINLKSILFCGGEVFILPNFTQLVNYYLSQGVFVSIITNGTIDKLTKISIPNNVQLLVSLDGPQPIHDKNRGQGNYQKSILFINKAKDLGFHVEVMFLVSPKSYPYIDSLPKELSVKFNYMTLKTKFYTHAHPLSVDQTAPGLSLEQIINIKKNYPSIPSKNFGCYQIALQSNGWIYGCCESGRPLGRATDDIQELISKFKQRLTNCQTCTVSSCHGCSDNNFLCGYKAELAKLACTQVSPLFN